MPQSLTDEMEEIARLAVQNTLADESETQKLFMTTADDERIVALLAVGPGTEIARVARMLVYQTEPVTAILVTEGWSVFAKPDETDPDRRAVMRGDKRPSEIPVEKREEVLVLYGESASGESKVRMWKVLNLPNGIRDLAELPGEVHYDTRFRPLFVVEHAERLLAEDLAGANPLDLPPEMHAEFQRVTNELTPERRHELLRRALGRMLLEGGGGTSAEWEKIRRERRKR